MNLHHSQKDIGFKHVTPPFGISVHQILQKQHYIFQVILDFVQLGPLKQTHEMMIRNKSVQLIYIFHHIQVHYIYWSVHTKHMFTIIHFALGSPKNPIELMIFELPHNNS